MPKTYVGLPSAPPLGPSCSGVSTATTSTYQTANSVFPYCDSPTSIQSRDFSSLRGDIPIVAVMGPTGAGKSTLIKVATGADDIQIGNSLGSCTQKIQVVQCHNPSRNSDIRFIDTPGFDDTVRTDAEILEEIANWLQETYQAGIELSGILYLHRITDNRVSGTLFRNLDLFLKLCGDNALSNVTLVTTHWDQLQDTKEGIKNEEELRDNYWKPFLASGSQMMRFEYTCSSAWNIINSLPMVQRPLEIQREMVDQGKPLSDTAAGRSMIGWFLQVTETLKEFIRRLEYLIKKVTSSPSDDLESAQREKELKEAKASLKEMEKQQARLRSRRRGSDPGSVRFSNESSLSGDSNSSGSSWRYIVHKMYDRPEGSLRRRISHKLSHRRTSVKIEVQSVESVSLQGSSDAVCDIPNTDSFWEAATANSSASKLTGTIQTLKLARATVTGIPLPGLGAAVGIALRIAESLNEIRNTHHSLVVLVNNVSLFIRTICEPGQQVHQYPKEVNNAIEEFCRRLRQVERIAKKIKMSSKLHRYVLQPDDQRAIIDCNDAIKLALQTLGIRIGLTVAVQNQNIYAKLIDLERLVTNMVATYAEQEEKRKKTT